MKKVLVTGAAGFIGYYTTQELVRKGFEVVGIDNLNNYYDPKLKLSRLKELGIRSGTFEYFEEIKSSDYSDLVFIKLDLSDQKAISELFSKYRFDYVVHLAAQAGVRESISNPNAYINSNINGMMTILEGCRHFPVKHLLFASSSSVYGNNKKVPFAESDRVDEPVSLYAATKKSGELLAFTYAHLYEIPVTALRFFTVYGPWGRPDMAYFKFTDAILNGREIEVFNNGDLYRDFTFIEDITDAIMKLIETLPETIPPFSLMNIGHSEPVKLLDFISIIESCTGKKAKMKMLPMQAGDVYKTYADADRLKQKIGFKPTTNIEQGLLAFVKWFREFYEC